MRRPAFLGGGAGGFAPTIPAITIEFAWVGNVGPTSATVKARSTDAVAITLRFSTDPGLANWVSVAGTEGADSMWTFELTGMTADTVYYYGFLGSALTGQLRTFPTAGSEASFVVAAGACHGNNAEYPGAANTSNSPAFDRIRDRDPLLFVHMGDIHYRNIATNDPSLFRTAYQDVFDNSRFAQLAREVPMAYTWDDHDFGGNNADGTSASRPAVQQVYREYVPHYTLPSTSLIYQTFVVGRVRFILIDSRSGRSPNTDTDNALKTRLGLAQKEWLKSTLLAASEPCIVLMVASAWVDTPTHDDGWNKFTTERQELAEFFEDNALTERLLLIGGDTHGMGADDGTNTQFDPGSVDPGPPYAGFAPMDCNFNGPFGATYSEGFYQTTQQQYGTLSFDDQGTQIVVTIKGWAVTDLTESEEFSFAATYPA